MDPLLATVYKRIGRLAFRHDFFSIARFDDQVNGLRYLNDLHLPRWPEPWHSLLVFGKEDALAYFFATVPLLSDTQGIQPVVWVDSYEDIYAIPVASSVDRFFDTFSRYLELIFQTPEYKDDTDVRPNFPWGTPELLRGDQKLVGLLREGRFDSLMYSNERRARERTHAEIQRWVGKVLAAPS